jgi:hypothetical protein
MKAVKGGKLSGGCTTHGQMKIYFVGRPERNELLTRSSLTWEDPINTDLKGI